MSLPQHFRERASGAFIGEFLDVFCRAYLSVTGIFILRKRSARLAAGTSSFTLGCIAVPLAVFAPEHFGGPTGVPDLVPSWMPAHLFRAYFVGCALFEALAAALLKGVPEIGWALVSQVRGRGFATEAVRAVVSWGDEALPSRRPFASSPLRTFSPFLLR